MFLILKIRMFNKQISYKYIIKPSLTGNCKIYKITYVAGVPKKKQMLKKGLTAEDAANEQYLLTEKLKQ